MILVAERKKLEWVYDNNASHCNVRPIAEHAPEQIREQEGFFMVQTCTTFLHHIQLFVCPRKRQI